MILTYSINIASLLLCLLLGGISGVVSANSLTGFVHGYAYARTAVVNEAGNYTWGEFDPATGAYLRTIGEASGELNPAEWRTMSGTEYRHFVQIKTELHQAQPDALILSRSQYQSSNLLLADGSAMSKPKPELGLTTAYVSLLPQSRRFIDDPDSLILGEYPINPDIAIGGDILSLLYKYSGDNMGQVKAATTNRIGFQTAIVNDSAGNPVAIEDSDSIVSPVDGYEAAGPITNSIVEHGLYATLTGDDGLFHMTWPAIPCPGIGSAYHISSSIMLKVQYRRFNPKGASSGGFYHLLSPISESCIPSFYFVPFFGPVSMGWDYQTYPTDPVQFRVDLTVLSGTAQLTAEVATQNNRVLLSGTPVLQADVTQYKTQYGNDAGPDNSLTATQGYDFDRDGTPDQVLTGHLQADPAAPAQDPDRKIFVAGESAELQGVWLSSGGKTPATAQPDLTRVMDSSSFTDTQHQGLLSQISAEDLSNTDLYIVRVSDGKLISERIGLNELDKESAPVGTDNLGRFFYNIPMPGGLNVLDYSRYSESFFSDWQASSGINPELHQREADHLQPGDAIRIYAINRATGYIGHVDTTMQATLANGDLSFPIDPIIMGPPNLKIRAERGYKIEQGATATNDTITRLIGFEGASLTSDTTVTITTEWLDHQGHPLPESLAGAGYTGRIAMLSDNKTLPSDSQGVYQFPIEPGRRLQVLQLPSEITDSQHFYIHVSGEPQSGNPIFAGSTSNQRLREADFSTSGQNPGILARRPDHYVPFQVPVYDEAASELQTQAYRLLKQISPGQVSGTPEPIYRWVYRPEMQFTSYDLKVDAINRSRDADDSGSIEADETINLINDDTPLITSDAMIDILYGLGTTELLPLDYFNAGRDKELIFVIGETEVTATLGEDQTLHFGDLSHLNLLSPDDFLTIRLYANNDMGNTLWEWAFGTIDLFTDMNRDGRILKKGTDEISFVDTRNSEKRPFYFWINDDDDEGEINEGKGAGGDIPGDSYPDHDNAVVDGMRDLVDFFPVYVDVKAALASHPPETYTYRLKHAGGALKFLETDNLLPDSTDKQKRPDAPLRDASVALNLADRAVTTLDNNGVDLSMDFLRKIQQDQGGIILLEATEKTGEPLILEIVDNGSQNIIASTKLHLSIDTVDKMYRHVNLQDVALENGENIEAGALSRTGVPENYPDEETTPDYLVFVHGYNVSGEAAKGWNAEMFKRFYQLGSTGRFVGVTWHGDTGLDYHHAVFNAFVTSMVLNSRLLEATPSRSSLTIAGHSLGNMVVSNAIAEGGLQPTRYIMLNAAVPIEAYSREQKVNEESIQMSRNMTEADWYEYPEKLYSAKWYQLFDESDARRAITWENRFEAVLPYAYNFYSPGEDVVENANIDEYFLSNVWTTIFDNGRHAWVQQEIGKGCKNLISGAVFSRCQAGWSFNINQDDLEYVGEEDPFYEPDTFSNQYWRYQTGSDAITALNNGDLTNEELAQFGFFRRFNEGFENLYAPIQAGNELRTNGPTIADAQTIASAQQTQWELLAHGIPAQSFAAAANSVDKLTPDIGLSRNFDMHLMRDLDGSGQPQWPQGRISGEPEDYHWFHSDVRNMATPYVYRVYEAMLDIGGLRSEAP